MADKGAPAGAPAPNDATEVMGASRIAALLDAALPAQKEPPPHQAPWAPPERIDEYRKVRLLGQGAMGQVFLYQDTALGRSVAIKFLAGLATDDATAQQRFLIEARAIARLSHPNVLTIYRVGEVEGRPFLASEYVAGSTLEHQSRPVSAERALQVGLELARGLAAAHRSGVLHRDIKPANVFLSGDGQVKLGDFGLAKLAPEGATAGSTLLLAHAETRPTRRVDPAALDSDSLNLTQAGASLGTPLYMSPEAWEGQTPSPAMDVYSVGVLLYELCCGHTPFQKKSMVALCTAVLTKDPPALPTGVIDPRLAALVQRCIRRNPAERFASGVELCDALEALAASLTEERRRAHWLRRRALLGGGVALCLLVSVIAVQRGLRAYLRSGMVSLPGGTFTMGSTDSDIEGAFHWCQSEGGKECSRQKYERELPQRQVTLSPFRIDRTEVTNEQLAAWLSREPGLVVKDDPEPPPAPKRFVYAGSRLFADLHPKRSALTYRAGGFRSRPGDAQKPAVMVTWHLAQRYCEAQGKRLPTEAEWEYAARAGRVARFPWGSDLPGCPDAVFGRLSGYACQSLPLGAAEVGSGRLDRSEEGVLDLGGNVSEWVADRFFPSYRPCAGTCQDPLVEGAAETIGWDGTRVVRGGSWALPASVMRATARSHRKPDEVTTSVGFRCALSLRP